MVKEILLNTKLKILYNGGKSRNISSIRNTSTDAELCQFAKAITSLQEESLSDIKKIETYKLKKN